MEWIDPAHTEYDERRALFNAMIDKRPRLIAACADAGDVRAALDRARARIAWRWRSARAATRSPGSPPTTTAW